MRKSGAWQYEPYQALDLPPAVFNIWLFASEKRGAAFSPGKSGCAWEIRTESNDLIESPGPKKSDSTESTQWRAYIAAATRSLERVPSESTAIICSRNQTFLQAIEAIDQWKANGWRKKGGDEVEDTDIWERFLLARDGDSERRKVVIVKVRAPTTALDEQIIRQLQKKTAAMLRQK